MDLATQAATTAGGNIAQATAATLETLMVRCVVNFLTFFSVLCFIGVVDMNITLGCLLITHRILGCNRL